MKEDEIEAKYAPLVKSYNDKLETLSTIVSNLEIRKAQLDLQAANHQMNVATYEKKQVLLDSILKDIQTKIVIQEEVTKTMNNLLSKKFNLEQENNLLQVSVNSKKEYISDIEKYPALTKTLQEEMEAFQNEHALNKKRAEQELRGIKEQVKSLHQQIGAIIN